MPPLISVVPLLSSQCFDTQAVCTTSAAAGVIIVNSNTASAIRVTNLLISVNTSMTLTIQAATTVKATMYLSSLGGVNLALAASPMTIASNQNLIMICSVSGSAAAFAAGYTLL